MACSEAGINSEEFIIQVGECARRPSGRGTEAAHEDTEKANNEEEDNVVKERDAERGVVNSVDDEAKEGENIVDEDDKDVNVEEDDEKMGPCGGECTRRRGRQDDGNAEMGATLGRAR
mmetsp:Transcript_1483/g.3488  ORF Transcript_1483/g.3488 Transcript_1483/m.3488 type:complete len:118 (+) Transcript_1483:1145-1498(+)